MKKLVQIVLFSAVLCLCCCFSTFGSVEASAYTSYDNFPSTVPFDFNYERGTTTGNGGFNLSPDSKNVYTATNSKLSGVTAMAFSPYSPKSFYFPVDNDTFDYYFLGSFIGNAENISDFTFFPDSFHVRARTHQNTLEIVDISDLSLYHTDSWYSKGFSVSCKLDLSVHNCIDYFIFKSNTAGTVPASLKFEFSVIALPKSLSSDDAQMAIVSAINNQTDKLSSDISQAADDIQQSIEDQYEIEEEEDFGFSDIQEQYEEKMGVLTFGTETTLQMLDLFSPSNAGDAYIRVPGFSIDVQGESYQVWDDYVFRFAWIEEWIPLLVRLMRTFNVTMFYIAILSYINKVYERNFLAK